MEFDELFGQGRNQQRQGFVRDEDQTSRPFYQQNDIKEQLLNKLRSNPRLKTLLLIAAIVIIAVVVLIVILLFPLILKLLSYISENGIQGIIDTIWKGTK
jgi:uncharacterized membrane protein